MPHVLLTAQPDFARNSRTLLRLANNYFRAVDASDGLETDEDDPRSGGRLRYVEMECPPEASYQDRIRGMLEGYEHAAARANRGPISVCFGHGAGLRDAWVDLAPGRLLRIHPALLELIWQSRRTGGSGSSALPEKARLVEEIGARLRRRNRVTRIDLYSCSVGAGSAGQDLLDWLHFLWGIPVRGLRGRLVLDGNPHGPHPPVTAAVIPPRGTGRTNPAFGQGIHSRLLTDRRLWRRSHRRRPSAGSRSAGAPAQ